MNHDTAQTPNGPAANNSSTNSIDQGFGINNYNVNTQEIV
jgi:hypothetical protein